MARVAADINARSNVKTTYRTNNDNIEEALRLCNDENYLRIVRKEYEIYEMDKGNP